MNRTKSKLVKCLSVLFSAAAMVACNQSEHARGALSAATYFDDPLVLSLVAAACSGDEAAMHRMIDAGADVDKVGREGMTPLAYAIYSGCLEGVRALLNRRANPNVVASYRDGTGEIVFVSAMNAAIGATEVTYLVELLNHGGDPNLKTDSRGYTPIFTGDVEKLKILLDRGGRVDVTLADGSTPLLDAVTISRYTVANLLLDAGADPFAKSQFGSPIEVAEKYGERNTRPGSEERAAYEMFMKRVAELQGKRAK